MPPKKTKIDDAISLIVGDEALPLINLIKGKSNVSEFKIAEKLGLEINTIRNILYQLNEKNLVSSVRKKDKKKGWYIYYWTFNEKMLSFALKKHITHRIEILKDRLDRENEGAFFICDNKCVRVDFDRAMDFQFSCPECGELMHQEDNYRTKEHLKQEIERLEEELNEIKKQENKTKPKSKPKKKTTSRKSMKKTPIIKNKTKIKTKKEKQTKNKTKQKNSVYTLKNTKNSKNKINKAKKTPNKKTNKPTNKLIKKTTKKRIIKSTKKPKPANKPTKQKSKKTVKSRSKSAFSIVKRKIFHKK